MVEKVRGRVGGRGMSRRGARQDRDGARAARRGEEVSGGEVQVQVGGMGQRRGEWGDGEVGIHGGGAGVVDVDGVEGGGERG